MLYKIDVEKRNKNHSDWSRTGRAEYNRSTRIYIWYRDETIIENFKNRRLRPYNELKKTILPRVFKELDIPENAKIQWSQKAGCSCGCSPGFILPDYHTFDVHVNLSTEK